MIKNISPNFNNTEKYVKRRYSQALEIDNKIEPSLKKICKIKNTKSENDSDTLSLINNALKSKNSEFEDFFKHFMIPCNIYKTLAVRHKTHPIILKRNLSYLFYPKSEFQKLDLQTIADNLSKVHFHDENLIENLKGKHGNSLLPGNYPSKILFKFDQFSDSKSEKDWKTIEAILYLDIIHFYRDNRKSKEGFVVKRIIPGKKIKCNDDMKCGTISQTIDIEDVMKNVSCYRIYKSVFHFKVLAKEKKIVSGKQNHLFSIDEKSDNNSNNKRDIIKTNDVFPVTYEAMIPLYSRHGYGQDLERPSNYFVQPGKYQIFMEVTDMEKCDDSIYCGKSKPIIVTDPSTQNLVGFHTDSQWFKIEDYHHKTNLKNKANISFQIDNEEPVKKKQKPMQTRNKSLTPLVEPSSWKPSSTSSSSLVENVVDYSIAACADIGGRIGDLPIFKSFNGHGSHLNLTETMKKESDKSSDVHIAYKFVVKDKIVQWTQTKNLVCPWCLLRFHFTKDLFHTMIQLLAHLNNWHFKMVFSCNKLKSRAALTQAVTKNIISVEVKLASPSTPESWDFGMAFQDEYPARRMPFTELVHSVLKQKNNEQEKVRHKGHNRDYSHTWSAEGLKEVEFDIDSEGEENMKWMFDLYYRKIEEFTDLNRIEKRVIQMWNQSLLKYGVYLSESQLKPFLETFIQEIINDKEQLKEVKSMRNTFMLHLVNLIDFGVLSPATMVECMKRLDDAVLL